MRCAESLRVQAYFDGEVDAVSAAEIERHIEHCAECRALRHDLERSRKALRQDLTYFRAPAELRARVRLALDQEGTPAPVRRKGWGRTSSRASPFWVGAGSGVAVTALAATLAFFLLAPRLTNPLVEDLVGAHVRSLMSTHPIDVVSSDKHTVKPWFAGHTGACQ